MCNVNWGRLLIGTLVATIIAFFTDGFFHERAVGGDWNNIYTALGATPPAHQNIAFAHFALFEIGRGLVTMLLYIAMRPQCKPGPKTAAIAGLIAWFAFSVTGPAQFIPLGLFSNTLWIKVGAFQLVTSILAAIAGAFFYKEPTKLSG